MIERDNQMIRYLLIIQAIFATLSAVTTEQKINSFLPKFEQYIQKNMPAWAIPGMAVVIVTPTKILLCKGFGTREVGKNKPVDENTIFQIASLTKIFTASIAGILADKKAFSLHDLVKKHLPEFNLSSKDATEKATLEDLIGHRIGIDQFAGDSLMKLGLPQMEIVKRIGMIPFTHNFRTDYTYSNQMFGFMGIIMERLLHKKYSEIFEEYIAKPLGMTRSSAGDGIIASQQSWWNKLKGLFGVDENIALCHDKNPEGQAVCIELPSIVYVLPSTSGVNTTAHDLGILLQCHLNDGKHDGQQIIPLNHVHEMRKSVVKHVKIKPKDMQFPSDVMHDVGYGMGWFSYDYGKGKHTVPVLEHMGGYAGQRSLAFMSPSEGFAVAIITNLGHFNLNLYPEALRNVFLDLFLDLEEKDWSDEYVKRKNDYYTRMRNQRTTKKLAKLTPKHEDKFYTGTYVNEMYGEIEIASESGMLVFKANGRSCTLPHWNGDEFNMNGWEFNGNMSRSDPNFIEFGQNEKGQTIAYVSFLFEGKDPIFTRVK